MFPHAWKTAVCVVFVAGAACALAEPAGEEEKGTTVTVKTVSKEDLFGDLLALSPMDGALVHTAAGDQSIPLRDLVRITVATPVPRRPEREFTLTLTNGDVLYGKFAEARQDTVVFEASDVGRVATALESVAGIDAPAASQPAYRASVEWFDRARATGEDRILLTNGDTVGGFITSVDAEGIAIQSPLGDTAVSLRRVVAVRLASPRAPAPQPPYLVLSFRTGGRLTVTDLKWSREAAEARLADGDRIQIEPERIAQVEVVGGRWEWLSRHAPISFEHTPMLSLGWESSTDRNVLGGPIVVAGETFEHGIGLHSRSSLTYDLKGAYTEFVTSFGIDDDSGPFADVAVTILVDGQRRFEAPNVRRGTLHGPIRLDVARAARMELIVGFGENGDIQDRFNWVEPALIREP
jgi:hypothetical protein